MNVPFTMDIFFLFKAWERLEKAEHERGVALRKELIRQEKLELLAQRFDHKTTMRQAWLNENQRLVSQVNSLSVYNNITGLWYCH